MPGDVCLLGLGDKIPADLRMISVSNLATGEAALTGESVPIDKVRHLHVMSRLMMMIITCHYAIVLPLFIVNSS